MSLAACNFIVPNAKPPAASPRLHSIACASAGWSVPRRARVATVFEIALNDAADNLPIIPPRACASSLISVISISVGCVEPTNEDRAPVESQGSAGGPPRNSQGGAA